jgi:hypothetical protein
VPSEVLLDRELEPQTGDTVNDVDPIAAPDVNEAQVDITDELGGELTGVIVVGGLELIGGLAVDDRCGQDLWTLGTKRTPVAASGSRWFMIRLPPGLKGMVGSITILPASSSPYSPAHVWDRSSRDCHDRHLSPLQRFGQFTHLYAGHDRCPAGIAHPER